MRPPVPSGCQHDGSASSKGFSPEPESTSHLQALTQSIEIVCRGGTISITGVYGGTADPVNVLQLFDKGVKIAIGQAPVKRWIDDLMPLLCGDGDPLGVEDLCTHRLSLEKAPARL